MANQSITFNPAAPDGEQYQITVHGRGSLILPISKTDQNGAPIDISGADLWFEVDGGFIRKAAVADPNNTQGQRIILTRADMAHLSRAKLKFAVVDESRAFEDIYDVIWIGQIQRTGYFGEPDLVAD